MGNRIEALSFLGYRAVLGHPLKRLRQRGTAAERFVENYAADGLAPTSAPDRRMGEAASACIGCGLCELGCDLASAVPAVRALGLEAAFRLYTKSSLSLAHARGALAACASCAGCEPLCPTGVPIGSIVRHFLGRPAPGGK